MKEITLHKTRGPAALIKLAGPIRTDPGHPLQKDRPSSADCYLVIPCADLEDYKPHNSIGRPLLGVNTDPCIP